MYLSSQNQNQEKANSELIKLLSNYFQVSTDKIKIIRGAKSRKKVVYTLDNLKFGKAK